MTRPRPDVVRFYVDADVLGLGKTLAGLRTDVTYPGDPGAVIRKRVRPACPVTGPHVPDTDWIPVVAQAGWLIITRDRHIQDHHLETAAVRDHGAKMVNLTADSAATTWGQLEVFMRHWRVMEKLQLQPGPFIWLFTAECGVSGRVRRR